jgi:hypothetical protein
MDKRFTDIRPFILKADFDPENDLQFEPSMYEVVKAYYETTNLFTEKEVEDLTELYIKDWVRREQHETK